MDIAEKMAADIALAIDGGDWQDAKWFSKFHREAWIKAVQPYADEIERLRETLKKIADLKIEYTWEKKDKPYVMIGFMTFELAITMAEDALKEGE
jgi:hypothetical protein